MARIWQSIFSGQLYLSWNKKILNFTILHKTIINAKWSIHIINIHNKKQETQRDCDFSWVYVFIFVPFLSIRSYIICYIIGSIQHWGVLDKHRSDVLFFIEMEIDMVLFGWVDRYTFIHLSDVFITFLMEYLGYTHMCILHVSIWGR